MFLEHQTCADPLLNRHGPYLVGSKCVYNILASGMSQTLTSTMQMQANGLFIAPNLQGASGAYTFLNNSFNISYVPETVEYYTRYVDAFKDHGVNVNGLSLINEPLNYQGMSYSIV